MEIAWYCRVGERQVGPISLEQLRRMAARGDLKLTSLVRRADVNSWIEAGQLPELWPRAEALPPEPGPVPGSIPPRTVAPVPAGPVPVAPRPVAPVPVGPVPAAARPVGPVPVGPVPVPVAPVPVAPVMSGPVVPRAVPVPVAGPRPVAVAGTQQPTVAANDRQAKAEQRRRAARKKLWLLLGGTGGLLLLLVVIGVVMSAGKNSGGSAGTSVAAKTAADVTATNAVPPIPASDLVAGSATGAVAGSATGAVAGTAAAPAGVAMPAAAQVTAAAAGSKVAKGKVADNAASRASAAVEQILRTTQPWRNLGSVNSVSSRQSRVQITGVWLAPLSGSTKSAEPKTAAPTAVGGAGAAPAVDVVAELLKGSPAAAAKPEAADDSAAAPGNAPGDAAAPSPTAGPAAGSVPTTGPRVVCVEVRVTNPEQSGAPLNYLSWNQTPAKAGSPPVVLVDSDKHPLPLVPKARFSDPARRDAPLRLAPGQGVTDLLVFEAPAGEFEHLRLALRLSAMGQGDRYLGFEVPREMVAESRPEELVESAPSRGGAAAAGGAARAGVAGRPTGEAGDEPAAMPPPGSPSGQPSGVPMPREETILDLKKQIEDAAKKTKAEKSMELKKRDDEERKKNAEAAPEAAPKTDAAQP